LKRKSFLEGISFIIFSIILIGLLPLHAVAYEEVPEFVISMGHRGESWFDAGGHLYLSQIPSSLIVGETYEIKANFSFEWGDISNFSFKIDTIELGFVSEKNVLSSGNTSYVIHYSGLEPDWIGVDVISVNKTIHVGDSIEIIAHVTSNQLTDSGKSYFLFKMNGYSFDVTPPDVGEEYEINSGVVSPSESVSYSIGGYIQMGLTTEKECYCVGEVVTYHVETIFFGCPSYEVHFQPPQSNLLPIIGDRLIKPNFLEVEYWEGDVYYVVKKEDAIGGLIWATIYVDGCGGSASVTDIANVNLDCNVSNSPCKFYDFNKDGQTQLNEAIQAVNDYFSYKIDIEMVINVITCYFSCGE